MMLGFVSENVLMVSIVCVLVALIMVDSRMVNTTEHNHG